LSLGPHKRDAPGHLPATCDRSSKYCTKNTCFSSFLGAIAEQLRFSAKLGLGGGISALMLPFGPSKGFDQLRCRISHQAATAPMIMPEMRAAVRSISQRSNCLTVSFSCTGVIITPLLRRFVRRSYAFPLCFRGISYLIPNNASAKLLHLACSCLRHYVQGTAIGGAVDGKIAAIKRKHCVDSFPLGDIHYSGIRHLGIG
jgi:hypothetical protein